MEISLASSASQATCAAATSPSSIQQQQWLADSPGGSVPLPSPPAAGERPLKRRKQNGCASSPAASPVSSRGSSAEAACRVLPVAASAFPHFGPGCLPVDPSSIAWPLAGSERISPHLEWAASDASASLSAAAATQPKIASCVLASLSASPPQQPHINESPSSPLSCSRHSSRVPFHLPRVSPPCLVSSPSLCPLPVDSDHVGASGGALSASIKTPAVSRAVPLPGTVQRLDIRVHDHHEQTLLSNGEISTRLVHGCPHQNEPPADQLDAAFLRECLSCVDSLLIRYHGTRQWSHPLRGKPHKCEVDVCPMLCHRGAYICVASGTIHLCTEFACEFAEEQSTRHSTTRSCPITHLSHPLHFRDDVDTENKLSSIDRAVKRDDKVTSFRQREKKINKRTRHSMTHAAIKHDSVASMAAVGAVTTSDLDNVLEAAAHVHHYAPALTFDQRQEVGRFAVDLWSKMRSVCQPWQHYTLDMHVFLVMHLMSSGSVSCVLKDQTTGEPYRHTYIPVVPLVHKNMLSFDEALSKVGRTRGFFTKSNEMFMDAMRRYYQLCPPPPPART